MDKIVGQILADGTIKIFTKSVSDANHMSADELLADVSTLAIESKVEHYGHTDQKERAHVHEHTHEN